MKCPVCNTFDNINLHLTSEGFSEDIIKCPVCSSSWSLNHGMMEIVNDSQEKSFLSALTECVEADDYALLGH